MKKVFLLAIALLAVSSLSFAQNSKSFYRSSYESRNSGSFSQETSIVSLGYGFANQYYPNYNGSVYGGLNSFSLGPVYAKYEHGFLRDEVGLGGHVALATGWTKYNNGNVDYRDNITALSAALLGYYHFNKLIPIKELDVYACVGLSVHNRIYNYDPDYTGNRPDYSETNVYPIGKVGARYYVKPGIGFYAEAGYDYMSTLNLGVTFRLSD